MRIKNLTKRLNLFLSILILILAGFIIFNPASVQAGVTHPSPTPTPTATPTPLPPTPTPTQTPTPTPTHKPKPTKTPTPTPTILTPTPTQTPTPTPTQIPTPTPTSTTTSESGGGIGGASNPKPCPDQQPNQPTNITARAGRKDQVILSWTAPTGPVSDYSITYSDNPNAQKWGVVSTGNVTIYTISDLGTSKYYFWVTAVNGCMPGSAAGPVTVASIGRGPAVLGLSTTSGETAPLVQSLKLLPSLLLAGASYYFLKKNGKAKK